MYHLAMKEKKYPRTESQVLIIQDRESVEGIPSDTMVRTQVYLTRGQHEYLSREAGRRGKGMSAVLRAIIEEKLAIPEDAWANNPMLQPTPADPDYEGREDGSLNHDHYAYGAPKKYKKVRGKWVMKREDEP
jgi:hypothetical protein